MLMPEAPVHEYDCTVSGKDQVRASRKAAIMELVAKPKAMKEPPHGQLRFRVLASYSGHHAASSRPADYVGHQLSSEPGGSRPDLRNPARALFWPSDNSRMAGDA